MMLLTKSSRQFRLALVAVTFFLTWSLDSEAKDLFGPCQIYSNQTATLQVLNKPYTIGRKLGSGASGVVNLLDAADRSESQFVVKNSHINQGEELIHDILFHHVAHRLGIPTTPAAVYFFSKDDFVLIKRFFDGKTLDQLETEENRAKDLETQLKARHQVLSLKAQTEALKRTGINTVCTKDVFDNSGNILINAKDAVSAVDGFMGWPIGVTTHDPSENKFLNDIREINHVFYGDEFKRYVGKISCVNNVLLLNGKKPQVSDENSLAPIPIMPEQVF